MCNWSERRLCQMKGKMDFLKKLILTTSKGIIFKALQKIVRILGIIEIDYS